MRAHKKKEADKEFSFAVAGTITLHISVFAQTLEEAVEKSQHAPTQSFCHQCARGSDDEWSTSGELDCDPAMSELVEVLVDGEVDDDELRQAKEWWG